MLSLRFKRDEGLTCFGYLQSFGPERKAADWVKIRSITEQNDLDGLSFLAAQESND